MLQIDDRLGSYRIGAAEPFIMSVQMRAMSGSGIIDWSARRLVLSFYESGQTLIHQIEGVYTNDPTGPYFAFVRDGRFSKGLLGRSVTVELAERLLDGKDIISTGSLTVNASSDGVASFGRIIGNIDSRFTLYFDAIGQIALVEQDLLRFPGIPLTAAPIIDTMAGINSDGTPEVGEQFTGIRPTGNGPIVADRWLENGVVVSDELTFTGRNPGPLRYEADLKGPDGTIATSGSTITVTGPVTLSALVGSGILMSGKPSSGVIAGLTAGSTISTTVPGLVVTRRTGAYTFDGSATAGTSYTITETLAGATNSPRATPVTVQPAGSTGSVAWDGVTWGGVTWGGGGVVPITLSLSGAQSTPEGTSSGGASPMTLSLSGAQSAPEGNTGTITLALSGAQSTLEGN